VLNFYYPHVAVCHLLELYAWFFGPVLVHRRSAEEERRDKKSPKETEVEKNEN
jgi:hypothetical protein